MVSILKNHKITLLQCNISHWKKFVDKRSKYRKNYCILSELKFLQQHPHITSLYLNHPNIFRFQYNFFFVLVSKTLITTMKFLLIYWRKQHSLFVKARYGQVLLVLYPRKQIPVKSLLSIHPTHFVWSDQHFAQELLISFFNFFIFMRLRYFNN